MRHLHMYFVLISATAIQQAHAADPDQFRGIAPTFDSKIAQEQVQQNPESIDAAFVLFTALTRTDRVEEALRELRFIKRLADRENRPSAFDEIVASYEKAVACNSNLIEPRYALACAYYIRANVLYRHAKRAAPATMTIADSIKQKATPEVQRAYEIAMKAFDEVLQRNPDDIWSAVYSAHIRAEYTGNLDEAEATWKAVKLKHPDSSAPEFFLRQVELRRALPVKNRYSRTELISSASFTVVQSFSVLSTVPLSRSKNRVLSATACY